MNIYTLCDKIELQPLIKKRVFSFVENFDFSMVDDYQSEYLVYQNMNKALLQTQTVLGEDSDGIKILSCMLKASVDAYSIYQEKGISDDIYFATMKCFPRFVDETYRMTSGWSFDRYWWTTRQAGCHLFRIGELEYEMKHIEDNTAVGIHIPSDANFCPSAIEQSLRDAKKFFSMYYPSLCGAEYRCHSWLLDRQLRGMLGDNSNIVNFQSRFEIFNEGEASSEFIEWLFNTKTTDYTTLPENTSLQEKMKKHLLSGGVIRNAYGRIKELH